MSVEINKIKELIDQNLKDFHTISDIATTLMISAETLRKDFLRKERTGLSCYLTSRRVEQMKQRLIDSSDKCMAICFDVGIREDTGAKLFKKLTGTTMEEFRRQHRNTSTSDNPEKQ